MAFGRFSSFFLGFRPFFGPFWITFQSEDTSILDPLLRIVRVGCDGAQVSDLTAIFSWLDMAAVLMLFLYLLRFRLGPSGAQRPLGAVCGEASTRSRSASRTMTCRHLEARS